VAKSVRIVLTVVAVSLLEAVLQHWVYFSPICSSRFVTHVTLIPILCGGPALVAGLIACVWLRSRLLAAAISVGILCYLFEIAFGWIRIYETAGPHSTQVIPMGFWRTLKLYTLEGYKEALAHAVFTWCGLLLGRLTIGKIKRRSLS
jgi:hypothetical protein